ncbi:MAG: penicillin-binding protein 2 [Solirubrobacteraceae bacterium]|jgi:penicillin-binding protein 2|nr:penicillin-binding protein 2 [Solirubrobacteraceae bacterium]
MSTPLERARSRDPRIPVSPQIALRVAVVGGIAMVMFGVIFFRLWYLQVLSGEQYVQQANANRVRDLPIAAPRGEILDRSGRPIVTSRITNAVQIVPSALPPAGPRRIELYRRLGALLGLSARRIEALVVRERTAVPYAPVTIRTDAGTGALTVLAERQSEYPGVVQQPVSIRAYPYGEMAAQVLGHVDQISETELKMRAFRGVQQGTVVGQEGLEYYYDRYLRGRAGVERVEVNAGGYPVPSKLPPDLPTAGHSLKLTLDLGLQQASEKALLEGIEHARASGKPADAGAFVALDPRNGQVLAIGSYPSFDPNKFAKPLTKAEYAALLGSGSASGPLTDRAVNGTYPTGSTFKPITAMGALEGGVISPEQGLGAGSCIYVSSQAFCNAGQADYGPVGLVQALKVSSDTYFFEVGKLANSHGPVVQNMARKLGVGRPSGVDLPSAFGGIVPDPAWRAKVNALELACERRTHRSTCGYVSEVRPWTVGDNMHLAVGQGDLLTDPLQMAVAYSTLANAYMHNGEGTAVTPHLGMEIDESTGGVVQSLAYPPARHVHLNISDLSLVMQGIHEAASQPGGTSADVWSGWDQAQHPVFGKTGTAQHAGQEDQSWYMAYIADASRPIVIAATVEQGGFGAETAAPVARLMASKWFGKPERFIAGSSKTL